jgi:cellulose synthase/poly-beta-1,6-N-acetylglucosamine synthase-like glycosyltransferase
MTTTVVISGIIVFIYVLLMAYLSRGLIQLNKGRHVKENYEDVSIIVAFRNEEHHLAGLINSLKQIKVEKRNIEVILVNDHSEDASEKIISENIQGTNEISFRLINLPAIDGLTGKKAALNMAIENASFDILLFTDADCIIKPRWVDMMTSYLKDGIEMVCGPVIYKQTPGFSADLFRIEFLSLVLSGAGAFGIHRPVFCNGANVLVRKQAFLKVRHSMSGKSFASGDDVFLLHSMLSEYGNHSAVFAFSEEGIVETAAPNNFVRFLGQRMRWASKSVAYKNSFAVFMAVTVYVTSLMIMILLFSGGFSNTMLYTGLIALMLKAFADAILFLNGRKIHQNKWLPLISIPLQCLYVPYIVLTAPLSFIFRTKWKGRKIWQKI